MTAIILSPIISIKMEYNLNLVNGYEINWNDFIETRMQNPKDSPWPMYCHDIHHTARSPYSTENTTGMEKWRFKVDGAVDSSPIIDKNGTIYIGSTRSLTGLYALNLNGTLKWRCEDIGSIESSPAIDEHGIIYIGTVADYPFNYLYAVYPNGTIKWKCPTGDIFSSPMIGEDGTIYIGEYSYYITAIYPENGTRKWSYMTNGPVFSSPAIGNDGTIYCGSYDKNLYALNQNGSLKWKFLTSNVIRANPSIADDGTIYVSSLDCYLYALYPNGTLKWKLNTIYGTCGNPSIAQDGTIYISHSSLCAVNPNGTIKWTFALEDEGDYSAPAISADGTIFLGVSLSNFAGGELLVLNPDGTLKWRSGIICNDPIHSSPAIAPDGTVYIGSSHEEEIEYNGWISVGFLHAFGPGETKHLSIEEPRKGMLYRHNQLKRETQSGKTICVGDIMVNISVTLPEEVEKVRIILKSNNPFIMSASLEQWITHNVTESPYQWYIDTSSMLKFRLCPYTLRVTAYYMGGCEWTKEMNILFFNLKFLWRFLP